MISVSTTTTHSFWVSHFWYLEDFWGLRKLQHHRRHSCCGLVHWGCGHALQSELAAAHRCRWGRRSSQSLCIRRRIYAAVGFHFSTGWRECVVAESPHLERAVALAAWGGWQEAGFYLARKPPWPACTVMQQVNYSERPVLCFVCASDPVSRSSRINLLVRSEVK